MELPSRVTGPHAAQRIDGHCDGTPRTFRRWRREMSAQRETTKRKDAYAVVLAL